MCVLYLRFLHAVWLVRPGTLAWHDRGKSRGNRVSSDGSDQEEEEEDDDKYTKNVRERGGER